MISGVGVWKTFSIEKKVFGSILTAKQRKPLVCQQNCTCSLDKARWPSLVALSRVKVHHLFNFLGWPYALNK